MTYNVKSIKQRQFDEHVFYSACDIKSFVQDVQGQKRFQISPRIREHFNRDWSDCETISNLGMSPVRPLAIMSINSGSEASGRCTELYVECHEGMISTDEITLAENNSELMPTPLMIARLASEARSQWVDGVQRALPDSMWVA